jgi:hypothetical protein
MLLSLGNINAVMRAWHKVDCIESKGVCGELSSKLRMRWAKCEYNPVYPEGKHGR